MALNKILLLKDIPEKFFSNLDEREVALWVSDFDQGQISQEQLVAFIKLKKIKEELHETELFEKIKIQIGDNFYKEIRGHFLESWMCSVVRYIIKNNGYTNNIDNTSLRTSFLECSCRQKCLLKKELLNSIVYKWSSFFNLKNVH